MISFEKAFAIIMDSTFTLETESVKLNHSLNRVLAGDVRSDTVMPAAGRICRESSASWKSFPPETARKKLFGRMSVLK